MMRAFAAIALAILFVGPGAETTSGQSTPNQQTFEVADVRVSPRRQNVVMRTNIRAGRYELLNASMVDLVRTAYRVNADNVIGGPNWVEYDRFDVIAKAPSDTSPETVAPMLQALLADRFKLVVHNETRPVVGHVLTLGKNKHKLKEADPAGKTGCQPQASTAPLISSVGGQISVPMTNFVCRNITMEAFAAALMGLSGGYVTNVAVDNTDLKGAWDFDFKFTNRGLAQLVGTDAVSLSDAIDKQLGMKLEEQKIPRPVIVLDQVNRTPTANLPDIDAKLPALPPAEFEVADIKPSVPGAPMNGPALLGFQPGGRVNLPRFPLRLAITLAWNITNTTEEIQGAPKWINSTQFDIIAKAPVAFVPPNGGLGNTEDLGLMLQGLLKDRFKMKVHYEDQLVTAYTLVAEKHKLKKADPASRTGCKLGTTGAILIAANATPPSRTVACQNMTMAQFVDQLQIIAGTYVRYPVVDGTKLEGAWDFSFSFSAIPPNQLAGLRGNPFGAVPPGVAPPGAPTDPGAADPVGGTTIFDAVEKQLGLKLEAEKRRYPVFVIDHIEEKPTEN